MCRPLRFPYLLGHQTCQSTDLMPEMWKTVLYQHGIGYFFGQCQHVCPQGACHLSLCKNCKQTGKSSKILISIQSQRIKTLTTMSGSRSSNFSTTCPSSRQPGYFSSARSLYRTTWSCGKPESSGCRIAVK